VFVYMFPALNAMGHGSHVRWVSGSWVNSSDSLPALGKLLPGILSLDHSIGLAVRARLSCRIIIFPKFNDRYGQHNDSLNKRANCVFDDRNLP